MNNAIAISAIPHPHPHPHPNNNVDEVNNIKHKPKYNKSLQINTKDLTICNNAFKQSNLPSCSNKNCTTKISKKSLTDTIRLHPLTPPNKPMALGSRRRFILRQNAASINNSLTIQKGALPQTSSNRLVLMKKSNNNATIVNHNRHHSIKESIPKMYKDQLVKGVTMNTFNYNQSNSNVKIALISKRYKRKLRLFSNDNSESISRVYTNNNNNKTNEARDYFNSPLTTSNPITPTNKPKLLLKALPWNERMRNISQYALTRMKNTIKKYKEKNKDSTKTMLSQKSSNSQSVKEGARRQGKEAIEDILKRKLTNLVIRMKEESKGDIREIDKKLRMDIKVNEYKVKDTIDDLKRLQNTNDDNLKKIVFITKNIM